jgi:hypothetical protein
VKVQSNETCRTPDLFSSCLDSVSADRRLVRSIGVFRPRPARVIRGLELHELIDSTEKLGRNVVTAGVGTQWSVEEIVDVPLLARPSNGFNAATEQEPDAIRAMAV